MLKRWQCVRQLRTLRTRHLLRKGPLLLIKEECQLRGVRLTLAAPEHQEMNGQVEVTWRTLRTIAHSLMVYARVPENYIHFALMYTTDHILPVLPIKEHYKRGWRSNNTVQIGNRYETFSVTFTCFILSMCCTESYGARWDENVKHASPSTKGFSRNLRGNTTAPKRISCLLPEY